MRLRYWPSEPSEILPSELPLASSATASTIKRGRRLGSGFVGSGLGCSSALVADSVLPLVAFDVVPLAGDVGAAGVGTGMGAGRSHSMN